MSTGDTEYSHAKIVGMKTLRNYFQEADKKKIALGHFNISNIEMFWAIVRAAKKMNVPVVIGVSEGERDFIGVSQCVALVESARRSLNHPIFLNADHTYSVERVKEAIDAGFDSVIIDGAKFSFEENVAMTRECVKYAKNSGREVLVEAELGYIGQSSKVLDAIPEGVKLTDEMLVQPADARRFKDETDIDLFAPAVGNIHGMLRGGKDPALNIKRIAEIKGATGLPLVLHGGSGTSEEDFRNAIKAGITMIHVSTELRVAYRSNLEKAFRENPDEVAPYKYMKSVVEAVEKVTSEKISIFNNP